VSRAPARVLVLSGLDPSGRAGLLADLATLQSAGGHGLGIATALTAQGGRFLCRPVPVSIIRRQLEGVRALGSIDAIKVGMVPNAPTLRAIFTALDGLDCPVVIDPVVRTSKGERLSTASARDYLALAGPHVVITPNLGEAAWLTGLRRPVEAGKALIRAGFGAAVVKGGHLGGAAVDVVCSGEAVTSLKGRRLQRTTGAHRGTGCRFASVLALFLARDRSLIEAAREAKAAVRKFLRGPILASSS
jgi:hydroxymethylpyrimidine/phosphomethylpyrimidine kinase